jgi:hypothetical protein
MPTFLHSGKLIRWRTFENIAGFLLFVLLAIATYAGQSDSSVSPFPVGENLITDQNKEMTQFFKAKEELFKQDWSKAEAGLEQYLKDYPSGRFADEALYWIAQCSNRLSKLETDAGRVLNLKENAIRRLNELLAQSKSSLWEDDASFLRKEISRDLTIFGFPEYRTYLDPNDKEKPSLYSQSSVMTALGSLRRDAAFPLAQTICLSSPAPPARWAAALFLAQWYPQEALPFLETVVKTEPDTTLQKNMVEFIERVRVSLLPVQLNFYIFYSRSIDGSEMPKITEHAINLYELPRTGSGQAFAEQAILSLFHNRIGNLKVRSDQQGRFPRDFIFIKSYLSFTNYIVNFVNADLKKELSGISGTLVVNDQKGKRESDQYTRTFQVNERQDTLLALRTGNDVDFVYFQFEAVPELQPDPGPDTQTKAGSEQMTKPEAFKTKLVMLSCTVHASAMIPTLRSFPSGILQLDLGPAQVEIPGKGGNWILAGMILCDRKARIFIGRQFTLTDPKGKVIAKGAYIEVPADNPQSYRTSADEAKSKTAVILSPELKNLTERRAFEAGKLLEFKVGDALSDALTREVMKYDGTASIRESEPASGEFDRIFKFSIDKARSGLKRLGDAYIGGINKNEVGSTEFGDLAATQNRTTIPQRYTLAVQLDVLDGRTMKPIRSERIEGYGVYNQRRATNSLGGAASPLTGDGADFEAKKLKKACDDAIAQVTASLAKALSRL